MNREHKVSVCVKCNNKNNLLLKIYNLGISINNIRYLHDSLEFITTYNDFKKLKKYILSYKFIIKDNIGLYKIKSMISKSKIFLLNAFLFFIFIYIFSNTIINVKVIHSKKEIREIVEDALEDNNIKKLTWKKNYKELNSIKNKILKQYPNKLEWLEIEKVGMSYVVKVEERIITDIPKKSDSCNIIATKSGIITKISSIRGQEIVQKNDYVSAGDILISGEIMQNEETKNIVCAEGNVKAEIWYTSEVKLPLNYSDVKYTKKKRYNFAINKHKIFRSRLKNYKTSKKLILNIYDNKIYLLTEKEIQVANKKYNDEQALQKALNLSNEKIKLKLNENERIIKQNVLKKSINDSTMYVEVFTSVEEIISKQVDFIKEEKEVE